MATVSVPIEKIGVESFMQAMFPQAVSDGLADVTLMMRQCQYRAGAILEMSNPDMAGDESQIPDAIEGAQGYIAAANALIDFMPGGTLENCATEQLDGGAK